MTSNFQLILGDCLEKMKDIPDGSVDMVLCDPPYGTTSCRWDTVLDLSVMWKEIERTIKKRSGILLFGAQPFSSMLVSSNLNAFKYSMVWKKSKCGSPLTAKFKPLTKHEDILVFSKKGEAINYYPIMKIGEPYKRKFTPNKTNNMGFGIKGVATDNKGTRHPDTVLDFPQQWRRQDQLHPTQKPVELMDYLIQSYTKKGDTVLDFTMGSGTTGVACVNTGRNFIGIELDEGYFKIAEKRIAEARAKADSRADS